MTIRFQSSPPSLVTLNGNNAVTVDSGTIDVASLPSVTISSGNISVTSGTIAVSSMPDVTIANATLDVKGSVDATLTGPVGISQGSTINVVNSAAGGQTPLSATSTVTTANATLSSSDYVLVSLPSANGLPAGSSGNLVYDSNLAQAIASVGATWSHNGVTIGTSEGDWNINNAGTDQAELVYYGTGSAPPVQYWDSQYTDVTPGITYTFSTLVNATNLTNNGSCYIAVRTSGGSLESAHGISNGFSGVLSTSYTPASGVSQIQFFINWGGTVTAGDTISFSQIQLTQTSSVQPYEPGPLFNNIAFKQDGKDFYYLDETTALALEDTGQALNLAIQASTSINSTVPQLAIPDAPTLSVFGTTGSTTATYGWVTQTSTAQGVVSLASNPGVNIGTIDVAPGAKMELAAGTAVIGTVNAQGSVDVGTIDKITAGDLTVINNTATTIPSGSEHNYSMTMTTAGTSYTAAAAVSTRTFFMIQNPSTANLNFGFGSLGNIFELGPLQGYEEIVGTNPLITLDITVEGQFNGQKVSIVTWE